MRKATIKGMDVADRLASTYQDSEQIGTIIEVIVQTSAKVGDRVNLVELGAVRGVMTSRWVSSVKVVHFTAEEWLHLRGLKRATTAQMFAAQQRGDDETEAKATARSKK